MPTLTKERFGTTTDGQDVDRFTLQNKNGIVTKLISYGAGVSELWVRDKNRKPVNVVLGFDTVQPYETRPTPYFGCTVGRYANRIAEAKFSHGGKEYQLSANDGSHTLHGGLNGLSHRVWKSDLLPGDSGVRFQISSPDGDEGFPGNLAVSVTFRLTDENELCIDYLATTDKTTPVNLTNHCYFNLEGAGNGTVHDHTVQIHADSFIPVNSAFVPTGEIGAVKGTPMDFNQPKRIRQDFKKVPGGYDHTYVLRTKPGELKEAARVSAPGSGIALCVLTTEPGVQLYTSNFLDGTITGIGGVYKKHGALCLEAQHFPDSVHHKHFPNVLLEPDETYKQTTVYRFDLL
jgi:aldose 1-epimerase